MAEGRYPKCSGSSL